MNVRVCIRIKYNDTKLYSEKMTLKTDIKSVIPKSIS